MFTQAKLIVAGAGLLVVVMALAMFGRWCYSSGYNTARAEVQAELDAWEEQAAEASVGLEVEREKVRTVYRTITREVDRVVEKPVYRVACFDDDGVRIARAALAGAITPPGKPDRPVPAIANPGGGDGVRSAADPGSGR